MQSSHSNIVLGILLLLLAGACGEAKTEGEQVSPRLLIDLDRSNPERLLRYYFGAYVGPDGGDPFEAGVLVEQEGRYYADVPVLEARHPRVGATLRVAARDQRLDWDELAAFLNATYYTVRDLPSTLEAFRADVPYLEDDTSWFHVELNGVMSTARRHVYIPEDAIRSALRGYQAQGERLIYPPGTIVVGEHRQEEAFIEATILRKRKDGFWDFFTYGEDGALTVETAALPRALKTPTQCVGCHFGGKLFEPERSFPSEAPPGPHGPRAYYVEEAWRDREVVAFFDEHRKRSDTLLGIYSTLFVARLRAEQRAGRLAKADTQLLATLGL